MTSLLTLLTVVGAQLRDRLRDLRDEPERGSLSVEQVIITVALIGIAVALVAVIANAVPSRWGQIRSPGPWLAPPHRMALRPCPADALLRAAGPVPWCADG